MPLNLDDLLKMRAPIDVEYAGQTVAAEYRPHVIDAEMQGQLLDMIAAGASDQRAASNHLYGILPKLLASWDVVDDSGPLEPTEAVLRRFPIQLMGAIAQAILTDINDPNRAATRAADETPSSSGSSRPALSALPRTGTG